MTTTAPGLVPGRVGWGWPDLAAKPHYFLEDFQSLCLRWLFTGDVNAPRYPGRASDCSLCRKALARAINTGVLAAALLRAEETT